MVLWNTPFLTLFSLFLGSLSQVYQPNPIMEDFDMESMYKLDELLKSVDPERMPSRKEILAMLEEANLGEDMKENLKTMLLGDAPKLLGGYGEGVWLGILFVLIIVAVLFFFGYKLYRSIIDKEKKREEKKKAKQMKKKK